MAYTDSDDLNYRGELFKIGQYNTPFITMMGGLGAGSRSSAFLFPLAQTYSLEAASQPAISETTAAAAGTPTTTTRSQDTNTAQIFKNDVSVTFKKQSQSGQMSGINTNAANPVVNELDFQKSAQLGQMAIDFEYTFLNGVYANATDAATAAKTRGIITGVTTNAVDASSAAFTKAMFNELLIEMYSNGARFENMVVFCNAFQKTKISDAYGYAPTDRNVGGLNIKQIETDFGVIGIVLDPYVPAGTILVANMNSCQPVFVPVAFDGEDLMMDMAAGSDVLWVPTAVTAAQKGGFFYSQAGIDYGPEEFHGKITNLATS